MRIIPFLKIFRINDWLHILGIPILGLAYASGITLSMRLILLTIIVCALDLAHCYAVNEVFDKSKNKRELFIAFIPFFINLLAAALLSIQAVIIITVAMLISYLYSSYPFRFKEKPFIEVFLNALGFSILFLLGYSAASPITINAVLIAGLFLLLFVPLQLIHELTHFEDDKKNKICTTVVKYGIKKGIYLIIYSSPLLPAWALYVCLQTKMPLYLFLLSFTYSVVLIIKASSCLTQKETNPALEELRSFSRYLTILYGVGMMFILLN